MESSSIPKSLNGETGSLELVSSPLSSPPSTILTPVFGPINEVMEDMMDMGDFSVSDHEDVTPTTSNLEEDVAPTASILEEDVTPTTSNLEDFAPATSDHEDVAPTAEFGNNVLGNTTAMEVDTPVTGSSINQANPETLADDNHGPNKPRPCTQCQTHKKYCDRQIPCGSCIAKKTPHRCERAPTTSTRVPQVKANRGIKHKASAVPLAGNPHKLLKKDNTDISKDVPKPATKPPGLRLPDIWCETRQELCEGLPYYRAYQSGAYGHDGVVHGYLLDGCPSEREFMSGKVVMSHCGGKSEDAGNGMRKLRQNQTVDDIRVKSLLTNMQNQIPLVLLIGNQCGASPSQLHHRYAVMDWFKITHAWEEQCTLSKFTRWRFRFEKLDFSTDGWWATEVSEIDREAQVKGAVCLVCKQESPQVYAQGWMCMNSLCPLWWKMDGVSPPPVNLVYDYDFLNARTPWDEGSEVPPSPLKPVMDVDDDGALALDDVSRKCWKGLCCTKCGRLSCREFWDCWKCANCGDRVYPQRRPIFTPTQLADPHRVIYTGPAVPQNSAGDGIAYSRVVKEGFTIMQYELPGCGTVTHMLANKATNGRFQDADWLLSEYQQANLPFRRYTMQTVSGLTRTAHFTYNVGAQYNYVANQPTVTFEEAHPVVRRARELLTLRVQMLYPDVEFNEVLNVGYIENQKMNFHQDGEKGLGPTVASISLGCPAIMEFRIKAKNSKRGRREHRSPSEKEDDDEAVAKAAEERCEKKRARLSLKLNHGDIVIMHGARIQTIWEHAAIPTGRFRIAATARYISEENSKKPRPKPTIKAEPSASEEDLDMSLIPEIGTTTDASD
ncbi:hypothetical protein BZA05DRAFT_471384 [Tricharina praecox]|uniref:uncharacterized protein n=1 Tax=Tricharina praecox TaxID=43433 RepID=UPI00221E76C4|nr:uncharacterized protein BZA05DRAFT_471384 [Tricharina praecox]KAI5856269.1 hypothetical protein BZA05DRAFT_471384 [Tricharina praecox]